MREVQALDANHNSQTATKKTVKVRAGEIANTLPQTKPG
jgi:hypothetical protein